MKKASTSAPSEPAPDDLLPEYRFDYRKAKPNRFAGEGHKREISVILNEDIDEEAMGAIVGCTRGRLGKASDEWLDETRGQVDERTEPGHQAAANRLKQAAIRPRSR